MHSDCLSVINADNRKGDTLDNMKKVCASMIQHFSYYGLYLLSPNER